MKKTIILSLTMSTIIYAFIYMVASFIFWEFKNPFQWIINIPTYSPDGRFAILFFYLFYQGIQFFCIYTNRENIPNFHKRERQETKIV
jgi:hypothetical protein